MNSANLLSQFLTQLSKFAQFEMISSPDDRALDDLCQKLTELNGEIGTSDDWVASQLDLCAKAGVFRWFMPKEVGGFGWDAGEIVKGYLKLSAACLTTAFVITQRSGAVRRIAASENSPLKSELVEGLASGKLFATVGISHLTTSRQHLKKPVLIAKETKQGCVLNGFSPWVTGSPFADYVVTGAQFEDGRQILVAVPMKLKGIEVPQTPELVAISSSRTGEVRFDNVEIDRRYLLDGPVENVMGRGTGANTGGLQTSTLAAGLADSAINFVEKQAEKREDLTQAAEAIRAEWFETRDDLLQLAIGNQVCTNESIRKRANSLVLNATQLALTVAKGAGFLGTHPAGRWCREALFFLVWSCPQPVFSAHLCELAGIES